MATHSSTLAWQIPRAEEPGGLPSMGSHRVGHDWSDFTFTFHFHALEKAMATHSSVLAWRIPGMEEPGGLPSMGSHRVGHDWRDLTAVAAAYLNGLVVFSTFFNFSLNLAIRSSWAEPQSAPGLVFADCIERLHLWLQRIESTWFQCGPSGDVHVQSLLLCCWKRVFAMTSEFSWQNSISLCPASFCTPRPNLPVTPGVSWLSTFAFGSPMMKRHLFWVLVLEGLVSPHRTVQLQLLQCYWLEHRLG